MKKSIKINLIVLLLTLIVSNNIYGQNSDSTKSPLLHIQFQELVDNAESYNEFKVMKKQSLDGFIKTMSDTLAAVNNLKSNAYEVVVDQKGKIENLQNIIIEKDSLINDAEVGKNTISVIGIEFQKGTYSVASVILVVLLIGIIVVLIISGKTNNSITKEAKSNLTKIEQELEEYKKRALDIQMKLKRELQTERNKLLDNKK